MWVGLCLFFSAFFSANRNFLQFFLLSGRVSPLCAFLNFFALFLHLLLHLFSSGKKKKNSFGSPAEKKSLAFTSSPVCFLLFAFCFVTDCFPLLFLPPPPAPIAPHFPVVDFFSAENRKANFLLLPLLPSAIQNSFSIGVSFHLLLFRIDRLICRSQNRKKTIQV